MHISKIIKVKHLPSAILTMVFFLVWYSCADLPLGLGALWPKYSLLFNVVGTIYVLAVGGSCIYVAARRYQKYTINNERVQGKRLFGYLVFFFVLMVAYNVVSYYVVPITKTKRKLTARLMRIPLFWES